MTSFGDYVGSLTADEKENIVNNFSTIEDCFNSTKNISETFTKISGTAKTGEVIDDLFVEAELATAIGKACNMAEKVGQCVEVVGVAVEFFKVVGLIEDPTSAALSHIEEKIDKLNTKLDRQHKEVLQTIDDATKTIMVHTTYETQRAQFTTKHSEVMAAMKINRTQLFNPDLFQGHFNATIQLLSTMVDMQQHRDQNPFLLYLGVLDEKKLEDINDVKQRLSDLTACMNGFTDSVTTLMAVIVYLQTISCNSKSPTTCFEENMTMLKDMAESIADIVNPSSDSLFETLWQQAVDKGIEKILDRYVKFGDLVNIKLLWGNYLTSVDEIADASVDEKGVWQGFTIEGGAKGDPVRYNDIVYLLSRQRNKHLDVSDKDVHCRWKDRGHWQRFRFHCKEHRFSFSQDRKQNPIVKKGEKVYILSAQVGRYITQVNPWLSDLKCSTPHHTVFDGLLGRKDEQKCSILIHVQVDSHTGKWHW